VELRYCDKGRYLGKGGVKGGRAVNGEIFEASLNGAE